MKILIFFVILGSFFLLFKILFSERKPKKNEFLESKDVPDVLGKSGFAVSRESQPQTDIAKNSENGNAVEKGGTFAEIIQKENFDGAFGDNANELEYNDLEMDEDDINFDAEEEELRQMFEGEAAYSQGLTFEEIQEQVKNDKPKTVRKFFGEAVVVTQEVDDIIQSPIVKESIINNSDCKILLDQRKYMNKFSFSSIYVSPVPTLISVQTKLFLAA